MTGEAIELKRGDRVAIVCEHEQMIAVGVVIAATPRVCQCGGPAYRLFVTSGGPQVPADLREWVCAARLRRAN